MSPYVRFWNLYFIHIRQRALYKLERNKIMNKSIAQSPIVKFTRRTNAARSTMLLLVVLSVVNVAMLTFGGGSYFLFSLSSTYLFTIFGVANDLVAEALIASAVVIAIVTASVLLSKKHPVFCIVNLVLILLDWISLIILCVLGDPLEMLFDIVVKVIVTVQLILAIPAAFKLKKYSPEEIQAGLGCAVQLPVSEAGAAGGISADDSVENGTDAVTADDTNGSEESQETEEIETK